MDALERQVASASDNTVAKYKKVGFVNAEVEWQPDRGLKAAANEEDIELLEESAFDDEEKVEITQKDFPFAVFGGLIRKREENKTNGEVEGEKEKDNENRLAALERINRQKMKLNVWSK